jgi:hypothetical protein
LSARPSTMFSGHSVDVGVDHECFHGRPLPAGPGL